MDCFTNLTFALGADFPASARRIRNALNTGRQKKLWVKT